MIRRMIQIDEAKCNGCGLCVGASHEQAIGLIGGKAKLLRDDYCDGLGDCLPVCPVDAITFIEREALTYDAAAVQAKKAERLSETRGTAESTALSSSGNQAQLLNRRFGPSAAAISHPHAAPASELRQWPVQIQLVSAQAEYFDNACLLIAADCTAYAYARFHTDFMRDRVTLIGCPKLDAADYTEKLTAILSNHEIRSLTVVRMEVPCCQGIENAVTQALKNSGRMIPWRLAVISRDGQILDER